MKLTQTNLKQMAEICASKITNAIENIEYFDQPYKHLVIDNFLDPNLAKECLNNFPPLETSGWEGHNDTDIEVKYRTTWKSEFDIPEGIVDAVRILNSSLVLRAMSNRFGIKKLLPDPFFTGGGLNVTLPGGLLDVHVDGNYHDATGLARRANALIYLNENWQDSWGGEFGIYDREGKNCIKKVAPLYNRLVIFDSHDFSFHGSPDPLAFPEGTQRRSIILYYYTKEERPAEHVLIKEPHSALWMRRNLHDKRGSKTRQFS